MDWYRNTEWNAEIRDAFMAKLSRARSQRDQYIAIQAISLANSAPEGALELCEFYFDTRKDDFDDVRVRLARATALVALGRVDAAAAAYKDLLAEEAGNDTLKVGGEMEYAVFVAEHRLTGRYAEVETMLGRPPAATLFPMDGFRWHAVKAVTRAHAGDAAAARQHADLALAEAARTTSGISRHPRLGLVGDSHKDLRERLAAIAAGGTETP